MVFMKIKKGQTRKGEKELKQQRQRQSAVPDLASDTKAMFKFQFSYHYSKFEQITMLAAQEKNYCTRMEDLAIAEIYYSALRTMELNRSDRHISEEMEALRQKYPALPEKNWNNSIK